MAILLSHEILDAIKRELNCATESVQIITAYCKESTIKELNSYVSNGTMRKRIMLRFLLNDLLAGSTDFGVLKFCMEAGWDIFLRFDLHAKTYIVDNKRAIVGSANVTHSGLGIKGYGNTEVSTLVNIDDDDLKKIESMYLGTIHVDSDIYDDLKKQYEEAKLKFNSSNKSYEWNTNIQELFTYKIRTLFSHEFPDKPSYEIGEFISFLNETFDGNKNLLKESLKWSAPYRWLVYTLKKNGGELYFGRVTELMHSVMVSDPKPYRKDVKEHLSNLLEMIQWLEIDEIIIDRPNYSQRIQLIK